MSEADLRIRAGAERLRSLRTRLGGVATRLDELERAAGTADLDRERLAQLETELVDRQELQRTLRDRLAQVDRMLGQ